jgi:uncharacterized protein (DUF1501 family)
VTDLDAPTFDRAGMSRRRFLQAAVMGVGASAVLPTWFADAAAAAGAAPAAPGDGILVVMVLAGGNDALNTLVPMSGPDRTRYEQLRGVIGIPSNALYGVGQSYGFHPSLANLHARFKHGDVAVVRGTGVAHGDLSHFTSMAQVMSGSFDHPNGTGWLGRYLDRLPNPETGLRAVAVSATVPMQMNGERAAVTALPSYGGLWGADRANKTERAVLDAVSAMGSAPTGLGPWGDRIARSWVDTIAEALPPVGPARDLEIAARVINADVGTRVVSVVMGGFDTHASQVPLQAELLGQLDRSIEAFFARLTPANRRRTSMVVVSEFGRNPVANGSLGTDHGTAGHMFVIGQGVRGGLYGDQPPLDRLDPRGSLLSTTDFRSVYATVLERWLAADSAAILQGRVPQHDLFKASPAG